MRPGQRNVAVGLIAVCLTLIGCGPTRADSFQEVAPGLFVRVGATEDATAENKDAIANIGFIVGQQSVAVIDPGGSLADGNTMRAAILARTKRPIRFVIITHVHPDHILGSTAFLPDKPVFIGHAALPTAIAERGSFYTENMRRLLGDQAGGVVSPDRTIATTGQIDLGGRVLEIQAHASGHTGADLTVFDPRTKTLWASDLLFVHRLPSLDGSVRGWLRELDALEKVPAVRAIPGHGPASVPWPAGAEDEHRYLEALARDVTKVLQDGGDLDDAVPVAAQSERGRWDMFDEYNPHNIAHAVHELEWENAK